MIKIKFVTNGPLPEIGNRSSPAVVSSSYFYLKTHYSMHGNGADHLRWLPCDFFMDATINEQADRIIREAPDILGLSVVVWNHDRQMRLGELVKAALPNVKIILGGPDVNALHDPEFFIKFPWVDYAVYGTGEKACTQILDAIILGHQPEFVNTIVQIPNGRAKVYPYEDIDQTTAYWKSSMIEPSYDDLLVVIDKLLQYGYNRKQIRVTIEFARGCMYKCSFCDWTQGLTNKVARRKFDWKNEIDMLKMLDITARPSDANFGQYPEDIKIFDYATSLYDPSKTFSFSACNVPKMKKDAAYHIISVMHKVHGRYPRISFQDVNEEVLKNIDRPEIPLDKHAEYLAELHEKTGVGFNAELIYGLPGQSVLSICDSLARIYALGGKCEDPFAWSLLPNSPANDPTYIKKHNLQTVKVVLSMTGKYECTVTGEVNEWYERMNSSTLITGLYFTRLTYSANTMTFEELLTMFAITKISLHKQVYSNLTNLIPEAQAMAQSYLSLHDPFYKKYGFYILMEHTETPGIIRSFGGIG